MIVRFGEFKETWHTLSLYERIEQFIALVLASLIAVIIPITTWDLAKEVFLLAWHGLLDPLDSRMFQGIFGQIMTLLIMLLAISRKFIILESTQYSAQTILGLAAVVIALGVTYWLIRDREVKTAAAR